MRRVAFDVNRDHYVVMSSDNTLAFGTGYTEEEALADSVQYLEDDETMDDKHVLECTIDARLEIALNGGDLSSKRFSIEDEILMYGSEIYCWE